MSGTFNETLARSVDAYIAELFAGPDEALERGLRRAEAAGLPPIGVSANLGKLLYLLARLARAERILELGTLGGYSTTWLARALPTGGRLITLEIDALHAEVARRNIAHAGLGDRVEIRLGPARDSLRALIEGREPAFDLVFIDADKEAYPEYLELSLQLVRPGSLILADNVIRDGEVIQDAPSDPSDRAIKAFNETIARHPRLDSLVLPIIREAFDGLSLSLVR